MEYSKVMEYFKSMEAIESLEQLSAIQASSFSDYKKKDQQNITKELHKKLRIASPGNTKELSTDDFANILAGGISG